MKKQVEDDEFGIGVIIFILLAALVWRGAFVIWWFHRG